MKSTTARRGRAGARNRLRIIGGQWRGRRLAFPAVPGLRPSPDRVRETLFNWLQPMIEGAVCLDLFAGSGALALEALSRGAAQAVIVDRHPEAAAALKGHLQLLKGAGEVVCTDALRYLDSTPQRSFDIVFVDPPFRRDLAGECLSKLASGGWVKSGGRVYLEAEAEMTTLPLPEGWQLLRSKIGGQVGYHLIAVP